jgi:serine/threonine-protein kinase
MVGRSIHQYQFTEKLGAGGMGEIYKAHDTRLNRIVAIKVLPAAKSGDPERRQRFLQEAQAASGLNHPSIITIHDVLSEGDTEFMVMEYVAGKTLNDVIPKGGLRVPQALKYALQMADALNAAHSAGIVHRDLKPANVMVTEGGLVKVLDFGLAKLTDRSPASFDDKTQTIAHAAPLTIEGSILGTVSYMSPEQAQGRKVDTRSDIFSFGAVLYEMLTGRRAFEGDSSLSTLSAILRDDVKPMAEVAPDVPSPLETLLLRCLQKDPEHRCQSMREVQIALSALKRDSDSGSLYTTRVAQQPPVKPVVAERMVAERKPSGKTALIGVIAAVVVLGGGATLFFARKHAAPAPVAQAAVETAATAPAVQTPAPEPAATAPAAAPDGTLNNDGVLEMVKENVPAPVILGQIRSSKTNFDLSTPEVIRLTKAGVPAGVIEAMRNPKRAPAPSASAPAPAPASAKQGTSARPEPVAPANAPIPAAEPAPAPVAVAAPPPTVAPPPAATPQNTNVAVSDGMPFTIALAADVPSDAEMGRPLRFTAVQDFRVRGVVVIPKGAVVTGQISDTAKKKFLGIGAGKLNFELLKAETAGGQQLSVRALAVRRSDGATQRPVETNTRTGSKDIVAAQGAQYIAYVDGEQIVTVPQK